MKVLLLLGLIVATVWAYPVAESEVSSASTVVVDYSAVAKDSESHEHVSGVSNDSSESSESVENSSEEKVEEPKPEAVKVEKELKPIVDEQLLKTTPIEQSKEEKPIVEVKPVEEQAPTIAQDAIVPIAAVPEIPKVEEKPIEKLPEQPLEDKVEEPVEVPVALPTVNAEASERKEAKAEDEPKIEEQPKVEQDAPAIEEEIKVDATEVKLVAEPVKQEAPKEIVKEEILPQAPIVQDEVLPASEVPLVVPEQKPEIPLVIPAADPVVVEQPVVEVEKKERKEDAPVEPVVELTQQEPIAPTANLPQTTEIKEELPVPLPAAADVPATEQLPAVVIPASPVIPVENKPELPLAQEEPQQTPILAELPQAPLVPIPTVQDELIVPVVQANPIVSVPLADPVVPILQTDVPIASDLPKTEELPVAVPELQIPLQQNQVTQEVHDPQQSNVVQQDLQETPVVLAEPAAAVIPEAPTLPSEVLSTPVELAPEQPIVLVPTPVKVEETPIVLPQADAAPVAADLPEVSKPVIPAVSAVPNKDLIQEAH